MTNARARTYQIRAPDQQSSYRCEQYSDEEECREDRSRCEDGLPGLETLLLEGRVWDEVKEGGAAGRSASRSIRPQHDTIAL